MSMFASVSALAGEPPPLDERAVIQRLRQACLMVHMPGSQGSGFLLDPRGFAITNHHVVGRSPVAILEFHDGTRCWARVLRSSRNRDLAMLLASPAPTGLPWLALATAPPEYGERVMAFGNPHSLEGTLTQGIVSHPGRLRSGALFVQTDTSVNAGNSGGPLVNLNGEVIGINVAIFSTSGGYQGIGFAVPINYAKAIVDQIIKGKKVSQGWIGISIQDLDYRLAQYFNLPSAEGVLVLKVLKDAPAQQAGLADGDIILSINDVKMRTCALLSKYIANRDIGETVQVRVLHKGEEKVLHVVIAERPALKDLLPKPAVPQPGADGFPAWKGLEVQDITEEVAEQFHLENISGVIVTRLQPGSPAHQAGIREGDIIIALNNRAVKNSEDFHQSISRTSGNCLIQTLRGFFVIGN